MISLPTEILENIANDSTYIRIILGLEINKQTMFCEGGPGIILETILFNGADIRSLISIKKYIPPSMAIAKAVLTNSKTIVKRVCILWDSTVSHPGFVFSFINKFAWGIENIQTNSTIAPWCMNAFYARIGNLDKIDFSITDPLRHVMEFDYLYAKMYDFLRHYYKDDIDKMIEVHLKCHHPERAMDLLAEYSNRFELIDGIVIQFNEYGYIVQAIELCKRYPEKLNVDPMIILCKNEPKNIDILKINGIQPDTPIIMALLSNDTKTINDGLKMNKENVLVLIRQLGLGWKFHDQLGLTDEDRLYILGSTYPQHYPVDYERMHFSVFPSKENPDYTRMMTQLFIRQPNQKRRLELIENEAINDIDVVLDEITNWDTENNLKLLRKFIQVHGIESLDEVNQYKSMDADMLEEFWFANKKRIKYLNFSKYDMEDKLWLFDLCVKLKYRGVNITNAWTLSTMDLKN